MCIAQVAIVYEVGRQTTRELDAKGSMKAESGEGWPLSVPAV